MSQKIDQNKGVGHIELTCENHPDLIWTTKNYGIENPDGSIQFHRSIFFKGGRATMDGKVEKINPITHDYYEECACKGSDLRLREG